jgi:hypothetical protein
MAEIARFETRDGMSVLVEVDEDAFGIERAARGRNGLIAASRGLEAALDEVRPAVQALASALRGLAPREYQVQFGIKLNGEVGAVVARTGLEGHFNVTMAWGPEPPSGGEASG